MGIISGPCASSHARATCAGVLPWKLATSCKRRTSFKIWDKFPPRVLWLHATQVVRRNVLVRWNWSDKAPRPIGLKATMATPSSRQDLRMSEFENSMSSLNRLYSFCTAVMRWTACARRKVAAETSDRPRCRIFPRLQVEVIRHREAVTVQTYGGLTSSAQP